MTLDLELILSIFLMIFIIMICEFLLRKEIKAEKVLIFLMIYCILAFFALRDFFTNGN